MNLKVNLFAPYSKALEVRSLHLLIYISSFTYLRTALPKLHQNGPVSTAMHRLSTSAFNYTITRPLPLKPAPPSNYISTTKYNIITFLPLALAIQFKRYANIYFLVTAILQSIPLISPLSPFSAVAPLLFVISLSVIREGYEDYQRYKEDKKSNSSKCVVFKQQKFVSEAWSIIKPADLIKISKEQILPCDIIPLISSEHSGVIYLETSSLDGEKNLKPKNSVKETQLEYNKNMSFIAPDYIRIDCIPPNGQLYQFDGVIEVAGIPNKTMLTHKNLLLRGSKLKNTEWVIGVAVYTGVNTKVMMNGATGFTKISHIESLVNKLIIAILAFQLSCCLISSIYCYFSCVNNINFEKLVSGTGNCTNLALISFSSYFILNNTMIPISLIVSLEFVKVFQGYFMQKDKEMYSSVTDRLLKCNTVSINEELGQIQYVLSDKTGTLTCNKMVFKQIAIGDTIYGSYQDPHRKMRSGSIQSLRESQKIQEAELKSNADFDFDPKGIMYQLKRAYTSAVVDPSSLDAILNDRKRLTEQMLLCMAVCHQCIRDPTTNSYTGPSPDEVTLVNAAAQMGFEYVSTQNKVIKVRVHSRGPEIFEEMELLQIFQFDSDRKRMSVLVRHNGVLKLYIKGADTTILPRTDKSNQVFNKYLIDRTAEMAKNGLRSLMFGVRILPDEYNYAKPPFPSSIQENIFLLGLTGIEDKLQDFVPETISSLRSGGIKFVLLTGDKLETAENISRSCGLVEETIVLNSGERFKLIETTKILQKNPKLSLVIDGSTIDIQANKDILNDIILSSESIVFCRVTPAQKAEVVRLVKETGKRTLAIGDGANDVNMILQAHVGVGLYGQEGMRAAQVSNYAIGEFCLLWKLLLHHGRLNYIRVSEMILYFFYKNMVFTMPQFVYSFYNMGSGQSVYLSWSITLFNLAFTFFPVVLRAVFQTDLYVRASKNQLSNLKVDSSTHDRNTLYEHYPKMYYVGQKNKIFNAPNFFSWFILGALQGSLCLMINIYALTWLNTTSGPQSYQTCFYFLEISLMTCIVIVVNVKLALNVQEWNMLLLIGFLIPTLGAYFLYDYITNVWSLSETYGYTSNLLQMPVFYFTQILSILGMFAIDLLLYSIKHTKDSLQNYIKFNTLRGRRLSQHQITRLDQQLKTAEPVPKLRTNMSNLQLIADSYMNKDVDSPNRMDQDNMVGRSLREGML